MSADNWRACPKCAAKALAEHGKRIEKVKASYGKVPPEKYLEMIKASQLQPDVSCTLREDYDIGMGRDGLFYVSYDCSCSTCGFSFSFNHEEKTP